MDLKNLEDGFEFMRNVFPEFELSKIHGKMKDKEKEMEMQKFCQWTNADSRCYNGDRSRCKRAQCKRYGYP